MRDNEENIFTDKQIKAIKNSETLSEKLEKAIYFLGGDIHHCTARVFLAKLYCKLNHEKKKSFEVMPLREWAYDIPEEEKKLKEFKKEWFVGVAKIVNFILEVMNLKPYIVRSERCASVDFSLMIDV